MSPETSPETSSLDFLICHSRLGAESCFTTPFINTHQEQEQDSSIYSTSFSSCSRSSSQGRAGRFRALTPVQLALRRLATTENADVFRPSKADLSREKSRQASTTAPHLPLPAWDKRFIAALGGEDISLGQIKGLARGAIEDQKQLCGQRRDIDVLELFLSRKDLTDVIDLAKFRRLKHLWLSFNKLQDITFLLRNPCLAELYLDHNSLYAIEGLRHLVSLNVLMLHNNQLKNLDAVVDELKLMNNLKTLNLYHNPLSQDARQYRLYTVYHLPSLWLLDRKEIKGEERNTAFHLFNHERSRVLQNLAFGRRAEKGMYVGPYKPCLTVPTEIVWSKAYINRNLFHDKEDAVFVRSLKRSVTQFSFLDWTLVPTRVERHSDDKAERPVELATVRIR
ncbi:leucine-rich repeat-containing protein 72 [Antechinus flavipes]|uniref:leucine-rich repeat-containing protein 72 n=1 Tax=Antechinus flavipes TaxID=38775 RepID=UPI002235F348|nr:leucine-rich repeat-containing protein 72 [Antechinus flavipes]